MRVAVFGRTATDISPISEVLNILALPSILSIHPSRSGIDRSAFEIIRVTSLGESLLERGLLRIFEVHECTVVRRVAVRLGHRDMDASFSVVVVAVALKG